VQVVKDQKSLKRIKAKTTIIKKKGGRETNESRKANEKKKKTNG